MTSKRPSTPLGAATKKKPKPKTRRAAPRPKAARATNAPPAAAEANVPRVRPAHLGGGGAPRLIVFPKRGSLFNSFAAAAGVARFLPGSLQDVLTFRKEALLRFASTTLSTARNVGSLREAASRLAGGNARLDEVKRNATDAAALGVGVLPALGAIVLDSQRVDRAMLEDDFEVTVLEDRRIVLARPDGGAGAPSPVDRLWHLNNIHVDAARNKGLDGKGILVGVLDTGIDVTHSEFTGKRIWFREFNADGEGIDQPPRDAGEHGTHVCGLIAGQTCGVAPKAELAVAAVLTESGPDGMGGSLVQILNGLEWLVGADFAGPGEELGVDLVSASLGTPSFDDFLIDALSNARTHTGTQLFGAIGNTGRSGINHHGSPADYDIATGVGAIGENDTVADFSDWGTVLQRGGVQKPDLCAPGVAVLSSVPGGGFARLSGTSMAAPIVAGAGALLLQRSPDLKMDAEQFTAALYQLVRPHTTPANRRRGGLGCLDLTNI